MTYMCPPNEGSLAGVYQAYNPYRKWERHSHQRER